MDFKLMDECRRSKAKMRGNSFRNRREKFAEAGRLRQPARRGRYPNNQHDASRSCGTLPSSRLPGPGASADIGSVRNSPRTP